jgi:nucleotide-binding universal stress UspA family protein
MNMSNTIAVGIDFSVQADLAALEAREIARHVGREVVFVHAASASEGVDFLMLRDSARHRDDGQLTPEHTEAMERARQLLDLMPAAERDGVTVRQALIEGAPDAGLRDAGHRVDAELLVVGTHDRKGLDRAVHGSTSARVIRKADEDVLVARDGAAMRGGYRRVLVAADFTASSERALYRALWMAAPDVEVDVIHFYKDDPLPDLYDRVLSLVGVELDEDATDDLLAAGQGIMGERVAGGGAHVRFYALKGAPIPGIQHLLAHQPYDLVALGCHGRRGLRRLFLGSVAEAIARTAPCSVLIARGGGDLP